MKRFIILLIAIVCFNYAQSQDVKGVSLIEHKKLLNKEFGSIMGVGSDGGLGNFASIDMGESEVEFSGNTIFKNGNVINLKINGALTDGVSSLFQSKQFSSNFEAKITYNLLFRKNTRLRYSHYDYLAYQKTKKELSWQTKKVEMEWNNGLGKIKLTQKVEELNARRDTIAIKLKSDKVAQSKKDEMKIEDMILQEQIDVLNAEILAFSAPTQVQLNETRNGVALKVDSALAKIKIKGISAGWLSFGVGVSTTFFKHIDTSLIFQNHVNDKQYLSRQFCFRYNYLTTSTGAFESHYLTAGFDIGQTDNFGGLTKREISETGELQENGFKRSVNKKYDAYFGDYLTGLWNFKLRADYYWFVFDNNLGAIHIFPSHNVLTGEYPTTNLGLGFALFYKDAKKNNVNAELFADFTDLFNNTGDRSEIYKRSSYGVKFSFPLKIK